MKLVSKFGVGFAICFLGCGASVATASQITYNINFTNTFGIGPAAGSFTFDSQAALGSQFSNFLVTWDGYTFDYTWIMHRNQPSERWPRSAGATSCVSKSV